MCFLFVYTFVKVVSYYDWSVLSTSVMGFQKKFGSGVGGGVSSIQVYFGFLDFFNFAKPLTYDVTVCGCPDHITYLLTYDVAVRTTLVVPTLGLGAGRLEGLALGGLVVHLVAACDSQHGEGVLVYGALSQGQLKVVDRARQVVLRSEQVTKEKVRLRL